MCSHCLSLTKIKDRHFEVAPLDAGGRPRGMIPIPAGNHLDSTFLIEWGVRAGVRVLPVKK